MAQGASVRTASAQCNIAVGTAFQWRHRFLAAVQQSPDRLEGIVKVDEISMLQSFKGQKGSRTATQRELRKSGSKVKTRDRSVELVPMLFAIDCSGVTVSHRLATVNVANLLERLRPMIRPDALLMSDANHCYPRVAQALDVSHEAVNRSAGEWVHGALHIQTVSSRHREFKLFLKPFRGIATSYLDSDLRWNHRLNRQGGQRRPHVCLSATVNFC